MTYGTTYDRYIYIYIYIYREFTAHASMWGSLRLAPIMGSGVKAEDTKPDYLIFNGTYMHAHFIMHTNGL